MIMASTPESHRTTIHNSDCKNRSGGSTSYFQKTVCLHDWWLIRAENDFNGKTLAVAGLTSRPEQAVRVFTSAPIAKRYDVFTLETADGICVVLRGFINKLRTADNGFTSEVFKYFLFGFPPNWETYAANCFRGEAFDSAAAAENTSVTDNLLCKSENADMNNCADADMNNCTPTNMNSPLYETSPIIVNKQDCNVEESRSPLESDAKQGLNHGDTTALDVMQNTSATETAVPFTDLAGSRNKTGADVQDEIENKRKKERESWKKAKRKIIFDSPGSGIRMNTRQKEKCMSSPECMSYGRSRSGRLLLPTMEFWRNQIPVYDSDRKIRGIQEGLPVLDVQPQPKPRGSQMSHEKVEEAIDVSSAIAEGNGMHGSKWVDMFVQEMTSAVDLDDARIQAARILEAFEHNITAYSRESEEEHFQSLVSDNQILKRAVAIQHKRNLEQEEKTREVHQLKHVLCQYQEQIQSLEVRNYTLNLHLQRAQSVSGHFHQDIF